MSYLIQYVARRAQPRRSPRPGVRVDERVTLNLFPEYDGGAHVRVFVEDTYYSNTPDIERDMLAAWIMIYRAPKS